MKKQNPTSPPHGSHVYEEPNCNCTYEVCETKRESVEKLVQRFDSMPAQWFQVLMDGMKSGSIEGTCFITRNAGAADEIRKLFWEDTEEGAEEYDPGWFLVGETGFLGREFDGRIVLAMDGTSYNYHANHWEPLYDALGYQWHRSPADVSSVELAFEEEWE